MDNERDNDAVFVLSQQDAERIGQLIATLEHAISELFSHRRVPLPTDDYDLQQMQFAERAHHLARPNPEN